MVSQKQQDFIVNDYLDSKFANLPHSLKDNLNKYLEDAGIILNENELLEIIKEIRQKS